MKTVFITGANRGLGKTLVDTFLSAGWHVLATARKKSTLIDHEQVSRYELDLADYSSIATVANTIANSDKKIDFIINNAGYNPKDSQDKEYFQSTFQINTFSGQNVAKSLHINALAPMELISKLLPSLKDDAAILNISSWLGSINKKSNGGHYGYGGSKALLNMFTKALALELKDSNKTAVALNPGWMRTDMGGSNGKFSTEDVSKAILDLYLQQTLHQENGAFLNIDGSHHDW